jgi:hypothetical protein
MKRMKPAILIFGTAALVFTGCASDRHYARHDRDRYYVVEEHPDAVIVERDANRVYVRDYENHRGSLDYQNNMEPRVRGKHAESLGWNTENYYLQRGYSY